MTAGSLYLRHSYTMELAGEFTREIERSYRRQWRIDTAAWCMRWKRFEVELREQRMIETASLRLLPKDEYTIREHVRWRRMRENDEIRRLRKGRFEPPDSACMARIAAELEEWLRKPIGPIEIWNPW